MTHAIGSLSYRWIEDWARIPDTPSGRANGRTHGVAVLASGDVVVFHQADPAVVIFDARGGVQRSWGREFPGAHGLTLVVEDGEERLWLTDQKTAAVVKTDLDGRILQRIARPPHPAYGTKPYSPTWVAVNETRHGGNGDVWVADGYGAGLLHRFDREGRHLDTLDGTTGAGAFQCPHGIWMDTRRGVPRLYVADRANRRVQIYDPAGVFQQTFGSDVLVHPDGFCASGGLLMVPELFGRVAVFDAEDRFVAYLGRNDRARTMDGWPNLERSRLPPETFSSPHAAAADPQGNLYIVEWVTGGRIIKLARAP